MELKYTRHGQEFSVNADDLKPEAIAYLLQYGFAQSLQDCVAGRAKKVKEELEAKEADSAEIQEAIRDDELGTMQKRLDAILAGAVGSGIRSPRDAFGSMQTKVTRDLLAAYAKSKGKKLPKQSSDEYKALFERFATANKDKIEAETKRRLEETAGLAEDLDEIFA